MRHITALLAFSIVTAAAAPAGADTVNLTATKDASIYNDNTSNANGAGQYFHAGRNNNGNLRRGLVQFNISSIPAGSTITSVTLTLRSDNATDNDGASSLVGVHRVTQAWTEGPADGGSTGGSGVAATTNDVTWIRRQYNTLSWTNPGGTFIAGASATATVPAPPTVGSHTWSGATMVADVQGWLDGTFTNNGWLVKGNEVTDQTARRFSSRTNPTVAERPKLTVIFTPPVTNGACCAPAGTCTLTTSGACGGTFQGAGTSCTPNPCPQPMGRCCLEGGVCSVLSPTDCAADGGQYAGDGTNCTFNPCPLIFGACCHANATCTVIPLLNCNAAGDTYQGYGVTCTGQDCPWVLTPFMDALPIPSVAVPTTGVPGGAAHYDIDIVQFTQQLHSQLPPTTVWGYDGMYPGPTFEAARGAPITVTWHNDLRNTPGGLFRTNHLLAVDTCLHGPDVTGVRPVTVTHLHGGKVNPESDGPPEDSFRPGQSSVRYDYPNNQRAATLWYHDHALGITRLNVYMGLAGFYLIRDHADLGLNLPRGEFEIPLVIQDRSFTPAGEFKYNATFIDHFFGDFILVNGKVWPYLEVKQGKYRFRIVNGSSTRTYTLVFPGTTLVPRAWQIGSDLGFLEAPVPITQLTLMPGERGDVVVNFEGMSPLLRFPVLRNVAVSPFPGGGDGPDVSTVMQFRITNLPGDTDPLPATLVNVPRTPEADAVLTRTFELAKTFDPVCGHDMWLINSLMWSDITDFPVLDTTEIWSWVNRSGVSHPMHMHLVSFQVLDRQDFTVDMSNNIVPVGPRIVPPAGELGWKDTVQATPNQITRVIAKFEGFTGIYPFHCHILDHEDHEMMRQFQVVCAPITFPDPPDSITVRRGQTATLSLTAAGSAPLSYQWLRADPAVTFVNGPTPNGSIISGATAPTFNIINVQLADAGRHAFRVTDPCGVQRVSPSAHITVVCLADFNLSGTVSVQDLFDFLAAYFANDPTADFNMSGTITVQDLFDFLAAYFGPC